MRFDVQTFFLFIAFMGMQAQETNQFDQKGQRHGMWRGLYDDTKHLRYEGTFEHGTEIGTFTFYDNTKKKEIIATRVFKNNGEAYTTFFKGKFKVSEGLVLNKKYEGLWLTYHKESTIVMMRENYKNGELHGEKKVYYHDGDLVEESFYEKGIRQGLYKKYALSGKVIEELTYKDGKMHGPAIYRDYQGEVTAEGQYKDDYQSGIWKFYKNGKLERTENKDALRKTRKKGQASNPSAEKRPELKRDFFKNKNKKKE
jgi:antitoxin component YwqK of YwqJK toxin-antitoxin module